MWVVVALGVVGLVALLRHAGSVGTGETGSSNGVTIDGTTPNMTKPTFRSSVGLYGTTGSPSPFTGLGLPGSNNGYRVLLNEQNPPKNANQFNAFQNQAHVGGTGLLDPLPDLGTRSKQLVTKDVLIGPGRKV